MRDDTEQLDPETCRLSWKQRLQVIGISLGFLLVFELLAYLSYHYVATDATLDDIADMFRAGKHKHALGMCVVLLFYVVGVPAVLVLATIGVLHGLRGRQTSLTDWVLSESSQAEVRQRHESAMDCLEATEGLSHADRILQIYVSPKIGWSLLIAFVAAGIGLLIWAAMANA